MDISTVLQDWPLQAVAAIVAGVVVLLAPRFILPAKRAGTQVPSTSQNSAKSVN